MIWTAWQPIIDALEGHRGEPFASAARKACEWGQSKPMPISVDLDGEAVLFRWQWQSCKVSEGLVEWSPVKMDLGAQP